ncbi:MAG: hypothetical protein RL754_1178 [Bacteroidota bacterium]
MSKDLNNAILSHIDGLEKKSGRPISYWIDLVNSWGEAKHMALVKRLKEEFGIGHGHANMVVHLAKENTSLHKSDHHLLLKEMFKGKEHWTPLYQRLEEALKKAMPELEFSHKKNYVSLRTRKQIAALAPATKSRFEVQLNLSADHDFPSVEALKPGGMFTHKWSILEPEFVDIEKVVHAVQSAARNSG